jgi:hypothetical protein
MSGYWGLTSSMITAYVSRQYANRGLDWAVIFPTTQDVVDEIRRRFESYSEFMDYIYDGIWMETESRLRMENCRCAICIEKVPEYIRFDENVPVRDFRRYRRIILGNE